MITIRKIDKLYVENIKEAKKVIFDLETKGFYINGDTKILNVKHIFINGIEYSKITPSSSLIINPKKRKKKRLLKKNEKSKRRKNHKCSKLHDKNVPLYTSIPNKLNKNKIIINNHIKYNIIGDSVYKPYVYTSIKGWVCINKKK